MRNKFADTFYEMGKQDERFAIVVADISPAGSIARFREEFPNRFINTGVAEQIMIGMVAGMAQRGLRPFAYTIATFTLYRPFEFVRDDLCYQELPVTLVGIGGGVTYSTLGSTHHAMEDIGVASSIPGMNIIAPCDAAETEAATRWCGQQTLGPVYLRLGKAGEPDFSSSADEPWSFGKLRGLSISEPDIAILTYGPIIKKAFDLAASMREQGRNVSLYSCHTVKPLDTERLAHILRRYKQVIIIEETVPTGSLGRRVKEFAFDIGAQCKISTFCLQEKFIHCYGTHDDLLARHGIDVIAMKNAIL